MAGLLVVRLQVGAKLFVFGWAVTPGSRVTTRVRSRCIDDAPTGMLSGES